MSRGRNNMQAVWGLGIYQPANHDRSLNSLILCYDVNERWIQINTVWIIQFVRRRRKKRCTKNLIKTHLIRRPDAVALDVLPTRHFQTRCILAVVFGNDYRVRGNNAVLIAEIILPETYLYGGTAPAYFGGSYLCLWSRWSEDWHSLFPLYFGTESDFRLSLDAEYVSLPWYQGLYDPAEFGGLEILDLSMRRPLESKDTYNNFLQFLLLLMKC